MTDQLDPQRTHIVTIRHTKGGVPRPDDRVVTIPMTADEYHRWRAQRMREVDAKLAKFAKAAR